MKWESYAIKDVYENLYDGPHATPPLCDNGAIYLGISNITENGHLDFSDIKYISENDLPRWTKRVIPREGDIVFSYEATLNRYAIIPKVFHGCLGRRMALIRPNNEKALGKFLYYYFFSDQWKQTIAENTVVGATVDRISIIKFPDFPISIPDLNTQQKIVDTLSAYDDLIENNQKQITLLEEAAQRLYKEWFIDLRFPGHENTPIHDGVPEGWKKKRIDDFGEIITGKTPPTDKTDYFGGDIPFVKIPDMHKGIFPVSTETKLTTEGAESQSNKYIPKGSIMVSCIATVGLVNIAVETCQTNQQINSLILNDENDLYYLYSSMLRLKEILDGVGSNGATMTNVNKAKFASIKLLYPTVDIRDAFHVICEPWYEMILSLSIMNVKITEIRDRLLPKLMSGEIEV